MPTTGGAFTIPDIVVHVGHDGTRYFSSDATGKVEANIDLIGGVFVTPISWTIFNRTNHPIRIRLIRFRQGGADRCPIFGGDFQNCEFESLRPVDPDTSQEARTVIINGADPDKGRYDYDLEVTNWNTGEGNVIDPELQIDN